MCRRSQDTSAAGDEAPAAVAASLYRRGLLQPALAAAAEHGWAGSAPPRMILFVNRPYLDVIHNVRPGPL